jgi:hypothetical protein
MKPVETELLTVYCFLFSLAGGIKDKKQRQRFRDKIDRKRFKLIKEMMNDS